MFSISSRKKHSQIALHHTWIALCFYSGWNKALGFKQRREKEKKRELTASLGIADVTKKREHGLLYPAPVMCDAFLKLPETYLDI